jgi:serine/threonine protein phosphatase PrpC
MSFFNNDYIQVSLYRDADLEAFYDIDPKYRRSIIFAHMMIHFLSVLVAVLFLERFWGDAYSNYIWGASLLFYAAIILETIAYMYPASRKLLKKIFPWLFIPIAIFGGYGGYLFGTSVFSSNSGIDWIGTYSAGIVVGIGIFIWTYLGMSLILKASRAIYTKKAAIEADVRFATEVQKKILQEVSVEHDSLCAYAKSIPANELGGDFFELTRKDDAIFACVGDVSGHSFGAGLLMTMTKSALQTHLHYNNDPSSIALALNQLFLSQSDRSMYSTMAFLKYNASTQQAILCNAGHLPVLHYQKKESRIIQQYKKGLGLGMISSASYENQEFSVQKGDILFLFSDGLIETRDEKNQIRDIEFFKELLIRCIRSEYKSTTELSETIFSEVKKSDHADKFEDDASLIIVET